jgi:DNA topoisomerase-1
VEGRVDLTAGGREAASDRRRPGRPAPVPVPPEYRTRQEQAKYDKLIQFAEALPAFRAAMAEHMERDNYDRLRVSAIAVRLMNQTWFRPVSESSVRESRTFSVTTLTRRHVSVRGNKIAFSFRSKHKVLDRTALIDSEVADAVRDLLKLPGGRPSFGATRMGRSPTSTRGD